MGKRGGKLILHGGWRNEKSPPFGGDHYRQASQIRLSFGCSFIGRLQLSKGFGPDGFSMDLDGLVFLGSDCFGFQRIGKREVD
jgi:hypothetical protein